MYVVPAKQSDGPGGIPFSSVNAESAEATAAATVVGAEKTEPDGEQAPQPGQQEQSPQYNNPQNESEARLSNVVYNETSGLRANKGAEKRKRAQAVGGTL